MIATKISIPGPSCFVVITICFLLATGCSKAYYNAMEKMGVHKRDILVDRVENARDAQAIGSLRSEFSGLKLKIDVLIKNMNDAITTSNRFIENLNQ